MGRVPKRMIRWASVVAVIGMLPLAGVMADAGTLGVVEDRVYRVGVYLVVDALMENRSPQRVDTAEVSVEFYDFFGQLLSAEHTVVVPVGLGPGQTGTARVVTPYNEAVRAIAYRLTWRRNGQQFQEVIRRTVWAIGAATRDP